MSVRATVWVLAEVKPAFLKIGSAHFSMIMGACMVLFLLLSVATPVFFLGCDEPPGVYLCDIHVFVIDDVDSI